MLTEPSADSLGLPTAPVRSVPELPDLGLARKPPAEAKHALLELAALLAAEVRMTQIILQALEARIVGLKKVVRYGRLLVAG